MGKNASWVIMVVAVYMAIVLPQTIWRIMEIKLELLCQIAPSIFLGLHYKNLKGNAVFAGAAAGTIIALGIMLVNYLVPSFPVKPWGIHAGIWGLMVNVSILVFVHRGLCKT
jgi:Na+/proline symporter